MSIPIENHVSSMESEKKSKDKNFKATELRLGLPGSESPERDNSNGVKDLDFFPSGAKRGFCDTINGNSETWGFGSEVNLGKDCGFINSGKGVKVGSKILGSNSNAVKEAAPKSPKPVQEKKAMSSSNNVHGVAPAAKAQVVGWPPIRSFRKNMVSNNPPETEEDANGKLLAGCHYVKVSMDGAPYLRKVDLTIYDSYNDLSSALEKMFSCFKDGQCGTQGISSSDGLNESKLVDLLHGSEYVLTYEDKDGDWMLVGDVPWEMFTESCKKLRIMKSSDVNDLGDSHFAHIRISLSMVVGMNSISSENMHVSLSSTSTTFQLRSTLLGLSENVASRVRSSKISVFLEDPTWCGSILESPSNIV